MHISKDDAKPDDMFLLRKCTFAQDAAKTDAHWGHLQRSLRHPSWHSPGEALLGECGGLHLCLTADVYLVRAVRRNSPFTEAHDPLLLSMLRICNYCGVRSDHCSLTHLRFPGRGTHVQGHYPS